jgi:hypothetical protein
MASQYSSRKGEDAGWVTAANKGRLQHAAAAAPELSVEQLTPEQCRATALVAASGLAVLGSNADAEVGVTIRPCLRLVAPVHPICTVLHVDIFVACIAVVQKQPPASQVPYCASVASL